MEKDQYINNLIKLSEITLTNKEKILLSKSNIKYAVDSCAKKLNNKNKTKSISEFLSCIGKLSCPTEYISFLKCMKEFNGNLNACMGQFNRLDIKMNEKVNESIYEIDNIQL